jgi:hypothetical protein
MRLPLGAPVGLAFWSEDDHLAAFKAAETALKGVGESERMHVEEGTVALHVRRKMTEAEWRGLPRKRGERFPIEEAS